MVLQLGCYYQDYAIYRPGGSELKPDKIDPNLCSIITYFVGNLVGNEIKSFDPWADVDLGNAVVTLLDVLIWSMLCFSGGFKKVTGLKNQNALMKVLVAIGGWNMGSTVFSYLAESPANRQKFTTSVIKFLGKLLWSAQASRLKCCAFCRTVEFWWFGYRLGVPDAAWWSETGLCQFSDLVEGMYSFIKWNTGIRSHKHWIGRKTPLNISLSVFGLGFQQYKPSHEVVQESMVTHPMRFLDG